MIRDKKEGKEEIKWRIKSIYVDEDTGEIINAALIVSKQYYIHKRKKKTNVYKQTGTITYTNECKRTGQGTLFE